MEIKKKISAEKLMKIIELANSVDNLFRFPGDPNTEKLFQISSAILLNENSISYFYFDVVVVFADQLDIERDFGGEFKIGISFEGRVGYKAKGSAKDVNAALLKISKEAIEILL